MADAAIDTLDIAILGAVLVGSGIYWFKDKLLGSNSSSKTSIAKQPLVPMQKPNAPALKINKTAKKTRDFVEKMKETVRPSFLSFHCTSTLLHTRANLITRRSAHTQTLCTKRKPALFIVLKGRKKEGTGWMNA